MSVEAPYDETQYSMAIFQVSTVDAFNTLITTLCSLIDPRWRITWMTLRTLLLETLVPSRVGLPSLLSAIGDPAPEASARIEGSIRQTDPPSMSRPQQRKEGAMKGENLLLACLLSC